MSSFMGSLKALDGCGFCEAAVARGPEEFLGLSTCQLIVDTMRFPAQADLVDEHLHPAQATRPPQVTKQVIEEICCRGQMSGRGLCSGQSLAAMLEIYCDATLLPKGRLREMTKIVSNAAGVSVCLCLPCLSFCRLVGRSFGLLSIKRRLLPEV